MGRVYEAVERSTGRRVAIKTVPQGIDGGARRMLLGEAAIVAQLEHRNIVRLLDVGTDVRGAVFLVMELVEGADLDTWPDQWPGWAVLLRTMDQVLAGLAAAHAQGVVHGDLKPGNILLGDDGVAKVTDFGIAHVIDPLATPTEAMRFAGTPYYMAPEQFFGDDAVGPWTDLYALGVMLHELVTGRPPHEGTTVPALFQQKHGGAPPLRLRAGTQAPPELAAVIADLLHPSPRRRPRFAAGVAERLRLVAPRCHEDSSARPSRTSLARLSISTMDSVPVSFAMTEAAPVGSPAAVISQSATLVETRPNTAPDLPFAEGEAEASIEGLRPVPFVGRLREVSLLTETIETVHGTRSPRVLAILGGAGVGKSRLARLGLSEVERTGTMQGAAAAFDISESNLAGGLRQAFRRLLGAPLRRDADARKAWEWLADADGNLPFDGAQMESWLVRGEPIAEQDLIALCLAALRALAARAPVYLWLDDAGWSRDGALAIVEAILSEANLAVLVVMTLRSGTADHPSLRERVSRLASHPFARFLSLGILAQEDRAKILASVAPLDPELITELSAVDETPLLLTQMVREWIDSGHLERANGTYRLARETPLAVLLATRSSAAVFAQRLMVLVGTFHEQAVAVERVLLRAALLGARFEEAALREACGEADGGCVAPLIDRALLHGIVRLDGEALRFDHGLFQEALLDRLTRHSERAALHRDVARALRSCYGAEHAETLARVATLLRAAGDLDDAAEALEMATRGMARGGAYGRATAFGEQLGQWLAADDVPEVHPRRAGYHRIVGLNEYYQLKYPEARRSLLRASQIFLALNDELSLNQVRFDVSSTYFYEDRFQEAEAVSRDLLLHTGSDDPRAIHLGAVLHHRLADLAALRGDIAGAIEHERACVDFGARGAAWVRLFARVAVAELSLVIGKVDEASEMAKVVAEDVAKNGDPSIVNELFDLNMRIDLGRGDFGSVRSRCETRLGAVRAQGDRWRRTAMLVIAATVAAALDEPAVATRVAEEFLASYDETHHDEAYTWFAMDRLARMLEDRALSEVAGRVRDTLARRKDEVAVAFAASDRMSSTP